MGKLRPSSRGEIEVRLLLDTAVLIYAVESPERLSRRVVATLENPGNIPELSAISRTEIAITTTLGKLKLSAAIAGQAVEDLDSPQPYTAEHVFHLFELPLHHGDPLDRQIIAQALSDKIPIATPDEKFGLYKGLKIIC
jgi:PIN domain nuclease of toxin-antitoxin system